MKDIQAHMTPEELAEYRRVEAAAKVVEGGCVAMSFGEATAHIERHREFWTRMHKKHQLAIEEFHVFDSVTGTISIDRSE